MGLILRLLPLGLPLTSDHNTCRCACFHYSLSRFVDRQSLRQYQKPTQFHVYLDQRCNRQFKKLLPPLRANGWTAGLHISDVLRFFHSWTFFGWNIDKLILSKDYSAQRQAFILHHHSGFSKMYIHVLVRLCYEWFNLDKIKR